MRADHVIISPRGTPSGRAASRVLHFLWLNGTRGHLVMIDAAIYRHTLTVLMRIHAMLTGVLLYSIRAYLLPSTDDFSSSHRHPKGDLYGDSRVSQEPGIVALKMQEVLPAFSRQHLLQMNKP